MLRNVGFLAVITCLLLACGESQVASIAPGEPIPQSNGMVTGTVVREDGELIAGVLAGIDGTNLFAHTDSGGRFTLFGVPVGDYRLMLSGSDDSYRPSYYRDTSYLISVGPGDTLRLDSMLLPVTSRWYCGLYSGYGAAWLTITGILNARDMSADTSSAVPDGLYFPGEVSHLSTLLDSIYLAVDPETPNVRMLAWHNGTPVSMRLPPKGRDGSLLGPVVLTGHDTLRVRRENDSLCDLVFVISESAPRSASSANGLLITTAPARIDRGEPIEANQVSYVTGTDTLRVTFGATQRVDWDICLVNDRTGDSCYWGNLAAFWARPGTQQPESADPGFFGDLCSSDSLESIPGASCEYVTPDQIRGIDVQDGSYSLFVRYFDGPPDSITATPMLCVALGQSGHYALFNKLLFAAPPRPMIKGEVWNAGKFYFPDLRYLPGSEIVSATPMALARSRMKERGQ